MLSTGCIGVIGRLAVAAMLCLAGAQGALAMGPAASSGHGPGDARKLAFVIGIDRYKNLEPRDQLQRAAADADAMARAFRGLGYAVTRVAATTRSGINAAWQGFIDEVLPGDTVAVFFAGHGVQIGGDNYLLPSNIPLIQYGRQSQLRRESLSVAELLLDLRARKPRITLVILDACRDNPLAQPPGTRSLARPGGLASMVAPEGTFIMYSAAAGERALDRLPGTDRNPNSVYTRTLLPLISTPGLTIADIAKRARQQVFETARQVNHTQRPAYYDGIIGRFCPAGCGPGSPVAAPRSAPPPRRATKDVAAARSAPSSEPARGQCQRFTRPNARPVRVRRGQELCGTGGTSVASVKRIANRAVAFDVSGSPDFTCLAGETCQFPWAGSPQFRIETSGKTARLIPTR
ncbi:MAG: caspase family protein [Pseudomonadota bacterium]